MFAMAPILVDKVWYYSLAVTVDRFGFVQPSLLRWPAVLSNFRLCLKMIICSSGELSMHRAIVVKKVKQKMCAYILPNSINFSNPITESNQDKLQALTSTTIQNSCILGTRLGLIMLLRFFLDQIMFLT